MPPVISVSHLSKTYAGGRAALKDVSLEINKGEIFALLGPNGAGKTTLISIICGIVTPSAGQITAGGHDIIRDYRGARSLIGLVPQELTIDFFESVWARSSSAAAFSARSRTMPISKACCAISRSGTARTARHARSPAA